MNETKTKYILQDLKESDIAMLAQAAHLPEKTWFCFGASYFKLRALELVDNELRVTYTGKQLLAKLSKTYN